MAQSILLEGLTDEQHQAVTHTTGPCLVIAGAGTGKTRVLTQRIAYLIQEGQVKPEEIVALTFTDKAAAEMLERVDLLLPVGSNTATITTFHSFTTELLRRYAHYLGLPADFTLLTGEEEVVFLHDHLWELPLSIWRPSNNPTRFLKELASFFSTLNDQALDSATLADWASAHASLEDEVEADRAAQLQELAAARTAYDNLLRQHGYLTFGHCITETLRLFKERPAVLDELRQQFRYLLIDEYQDTNWAQTELAAQIAGPNGNIMVVGDDDQSIYSFRGAASQNLIEFRGRFPDTRVVVLKQNFRSTQQILDASYRLIQHNNPHRLEFTEKVDKRLLGQGNGEPPQFHYYATRAGELTGITDQINSWLEEGIGPQEIAVLCRTSLQAKQVEQALRHRGIAVSSHQGEPLFATPLVRGVLAFCRLLVRQDDNIAVHELFSSPPFAIPGRVWQELCQSRPYQEDDLLTAARAFLSQLPSWVSEKIGARIQKAITLLDELAGSTHEPASVVFLRLVHRSGLYAALTRSQKPESAVQLAQLGQLFDEMQAYEERHRNATLANFLRYIDVLTEIGQDIPAAASDQDDPFAVNVMTVHKSKGLEFTAVVVPFCATGKFPSRNISRPLKLPPDLDRAGEHADGHQAEERRLFYVALTRAREHLLCTAAEKYGAGPKSRLSPFIVETFPEMEWGSLAPKVVPPADYLQSQLELPATAEPARSTPALYQQKKISYTQLASYLDCPWKYRYQYVLRLRTYPTHALLFGVTMHEMLRAWLDARRRGQIVTPEELLNTYWRTGGYETRAQEQERRREALAALQELEKEFSAAQPVTLEQSFEFPLANGQRVTGRIDRLDETDEQALVVIDYKTGKPKPLREAKKDLQLGIYILAVEALYHRPVAAVTLHYVMQHEKVTVPRAEFALEEVEQAVNEGAARLAADRHNDSFSPNPTHQTCQFCDYRNLCPFRYNG